MANNWSTTNLLASLKRRGMIPTTTTGPSSTDIYDLMTAELQHFIMPLMMRVREEWRLTTQDITTVANQPNYPIPARAIGGKVKEIQVNDTSTFRDLPRIEPTRVAR